MLAGDGSDNTLDADHSSPFPHSGNMSKAIVSINAVHYAHGWVVCRAFPFTADMTSVVL